MTGSPCGKEETKLNIKRILALLLASVLAVAGCAAVYAEGVDLSTYSDEELLALLGAVQQEVAARRIERTATLPAGIYIGGRDLPVGGYVLVSVSSENRKIGDLLLRKSPDESGEKEEILDEHIYQDEEHSFYVYLEEGYELVLPFPFEATMVNQIMFK